MIGKFEVNEDGARAVLSVTVEISGAVGREKGRWPADEARLSVKRLLKLARLLGCEEEVREVLEAQAHAAVEGAREQRERAAGSYLSALKYAGEADAAAVRALERLGVARDG